MNLIEELKRQNLKSYIESVTGARFNGNKTHCPFPDHEDKVPSFNVFQENGNYAFKCFGCDRKGDIINFEEMFFDKSRKEAIKDLAKRFNLNDNQLKRKYKSKPVASYPYPDEKYQELYKILKFKPKSFKADRNMKGIRRVPYHLPEVIKASEVWLLEGEKDVDNVRRQAGLTATTFPFGKDHWKSEYSKFFKDKVVFICMDVGAEKEAEQRAEDISKYAKKVKIINLPGLEKEGEDVSNWLELHDSKSKEEIREQLQKIADNTSAYGIEGFEAETVENILNMDIPPIEWQIKSLVERRGFTLLGAIKGVGKSLCVTSLGLHYAAGRSPFLHSDFIIEKPGRCLYLQQEVSLSGMKDRLFKMQSERAFDLRGRFKQRTTTGSPWNLNQKKDRERLIRMLDLHEPDLLILDPFYTFCIDTNNLKAVSEVLGFLLQLKTDYNVGLVVVHHFSNKPKEDIFISTVGRFMGSSTIANAADVTVAMEFLDSRYKHQTLTWSYNHYATMEVTTRHGEWPQKFAVERKGDSLLFSLSDIWSEMGKKILPETIEQLLRDNNGEMFQKDIIELLADKASQTTIHNTIKRLEDEGRIERPDVNFEGKSMKKLRLK